MKRSILLFIAFLPLITLAQNFKVVGYVPSYRVSALDNINYKFYTHLIASFINPDAQGNLSWDADITNFVTKVHTGGAKAIISIAGGGDYSWGSKVDIYKNLISTASSRTAFINKIMNYLRANKLDGLDNDMEGNALALTNYNIFTQELADSIHAAGLEISAAYGVGGSWGAGIVSDATLAKLDFVATMSYGGVGSWNWNKRIDEHCYNKFKSDIEYFQGRKLAAHKIVGGLPYYTVEFPASAQSSYSKYNRTYCDTYKDSRLTGIDVFNTDTINLNDGNVIYKNSYKTYKRKIDLASVSGGGIMVWEVGQECFDGSVALTDSLLAYMESINLSTQTNLPNFKIDVFPNPSSSIINIQNTNIKSIQLISINGKNITPEIIATNQTFQINISALPKGIYFIEAINNRDLKATKKIIVK